MERRTKTPWGRLLPQTTGHVAVSYPKFTNRIVLLNSDQHSLKRTFDVRRHQVQTFYEVYFRLESGRRINGTHCSAMRILCSIGQRSSIVYTSFSLVFELRERKFKDLIDQPGWAHLPLTS